MANEKNLIPFSERSENEAREIGRKGGRASGVSRRRKKTLKALMKEMLSMPITDTDIYNATGAMGVAPEDMTYDMAVTAAMIREGAMGNVKAYHEIRDIIGESPDAQRAKLMQDKDKRELQELKNKSSANIPVQIIIGERTGGGVHEENEEDE